MTEDIASKPGLRARANESKAFRCRHLIAVIEEPSDIRNVGSVIRNVNALGVEKAYVVTGRDLLPKDWQEMRTQSKLGAISASAIKWSFVKTFDNTAACLDHLEGNGFVSVVTSPHHKGRRNVVLHEHDYTPYKKLAVWFGNEGRGISDTALDRSALCINIPMYGIIQSLNLGTSSGIVLYEITKQRRAFQIAHERKLRSRREGGPELLGQVAKREP